MSKSDELACLGGGLCPTMSSLEKLGFTERRPQFSRVVLGFKLAACDLSAEPMVNRSMAPIVQVSGLLSTQRALSTIEIQLRTDLCTPEQAAAWLVFGLKRVEKHLVLLPPWWSLGESSLHLHPVIQERRAMEERSRAWARRPHCTMKGGHARLFRQELRKVIGCHENEVPSLVEFDGQVLRVTVEDTTVSALAVGTQWPVAILWRVSKHMKLPSKFRGEQVTIGYFDGKLDFDAYRYEAEGQQ